MLTLLLVSPLLGIDHLAAAAWMGLAGWSSRACLRVCAVFGGCAAVGLLLGLLLGESLADGIGSGGRCCGGGLLVLLGLVRLVSPRPPPADGCPVEPTPPLAALLAIGLAVSSDTIAAGFALALSGVPTHAAVAIMSAMAVLTTLVGFRLAACLGPRLGRRADHLASSVLAAVGAGVIVGLL